MGANMKLRRRCVLATVGFFIFLTDVQLLNAAAVTESDTNSGQQQTQTANNAGATSWVHEEPHQLRPSSKAPPSVSNPFLHNPLTQLIGNAATGTGDLLNNLSPLNLILPRQIPSTIATPRITTAALAGTTHKSTPPTHGDPGGGFLFGVGNVEPRQLRPSSKAPPSVSNPFLHNPLTQLIGNVATGTGDLLQNLSPLNLILPRQIPSTIATPRNTTAALAGTTQKSTPPTHGDPGGGFLFGVGNVFDPVLGGKQPTTALANTTVAPPAGGHGRGFPALMFNSANIIQKILEIVGAFLHWFDHPEPSYLISRFDSLRQSLEALIEIFLQRDEDGGIGEIPKDAEDVFKSIHSLLESVQKNNPLDLFLAGNSLFRRVNKLKDDFIEPVSTTPTPGGFVGSVLHGIGGLANLIRPSNNPQTTNHSSLEEAGEFGKVVRSTGNMIDTLGEIEEIIQSHNPNSHLLQFVGKIKDLAKLSLTNDTLDNENILDVLQKVWFPNATLTEIIGNFGKILQHDFPNNGIAQSIGILLQQHILVDLGLNVCVRNLDFLRFGNIKYSLLQTFANVENPIVGDDLNRLLAGSLDILDKLAETFELLLKTFHSISDPLFSKIKQLLKLP